MPLVATVCTAYAAREQQRGCVGAWQQYPHAPWIVSCGAHSCKLVLSRVQARRACWSTCGTADVPASPPAPPFVLDDAR